MQYPTSLARVIEKLNRAKHHIERLQTLADGFRSENRDAVAREDNTQTGQVVYRVDRIPQIPPDFPYVFGDAIQNLIGTLDYLTCELIIAAGNKPCSDTTFPIADSAQGYWDRLGGKIKGMRPEAIEEINRFRPYKGGFGHDLWALSKLNNIAKHRRLVTMAFAPVGRSLTRSEKGQFSTSQARIDPDRGRVDLSKIMILFQSGSGSIVKAGKVLLTVPPSEAQENMRFVFDIAINESAVENGYIAALFAGIMEDRVENIVSAMGPFLCGGQEKSFPPS